MSTLAKFAELHAKFESLQPFLKEYETAKKAALSLCQSTEQAQTQVDDGQYLLILSKPRVLREISIDDFLSRVPLDIAKPFLSVSAKAADELGFPAKEKLGARSVVAILKKQHEAA